MGVDLYTNRLIHEKIWYTAGGRGGCTGVCALGVTALASNIISTEFLENITSQTLKVAFHSFNIILSFPHPLPLPSHVQSYIQPWARLFKACRISANPGLTQFIGFIKS